MASKTRNLFTNAISLTLTALSIRAVSVIFNVYIANKAGNEAMGLFSLLGSVYAFSITVACASINLGTTRLVADAVGLNDGKLAMRTVRKALIISSLTSLISGIVLFLFSVPIAKNLLGDIRAASSLKVLATTLFPVAICSCLTGYFTAVRRVKLNASFQIVIQLIKIGVTVCFLTLFGELDNDSVIFIRTPIESIRESVIVTNKFLSIIAFFAISLFFASIPEETIIMPFF